MLSRIKVINRVLQINSPLINICATRRYCDKKEKWDLMSAVCLQRRPIISKELNEIELKFSQVLNEIEIENSLKSDHELRLVREKEQEQLIKSGNISEDDLNQIIKQTTQDFEDLSLDEFNKFKFASRITEADKKNDMKSLERKLDKYLILVVHDQKRGIWFLPQVVRGDGETMRQTAERSLQEICGKVRAKFYGNAPCGFYKYKYPKSKRSEGAIGAKVFFYMASYLSGQIELNKELQDYKWLTQDELGNHLIKPYHKSISEFLIDDS